MSRCDLPFANPIWLFQFFSLLYFGSHGYREDCSIKFPKRSDWLTSLLEFCGSPSCLWKWVANYTYVSLLDTYLKPHPWLSWLYNNQPTQEPSRRHMAILSKRSQPYQISVGTSHHVNIVREPRFTLWYKRERRHSCIQWDSKLAFSLTGCTRSVRRLLQIFRT